MTKTKEQTIPTKLKKYGIKPYSEGGLVSNPFSGDSIELNGTELSIYDLCIGSEQLGKYHIVRICLDWFRKHNANAYMVLLD